MILITFTYLPKEGKFWLPVLLEIDVNLDTKHTRMLERYDVREIQHQSKV